MSDTVQRVPTLIALAFRDFTHSLYTSFRTFHLFDIPSAFAAFLWNLQYIIIQIGIVSLYKPKTPKPSNKKAPYGKIAVIGAGITGVSTAAHAKAHNFSVTLFEQKSRKGLGGIWAHVNATSGLQINSMLYRFFPGVMWRKAFPLREEILSEVERIWLEYGLDEEGVTRFDTSVVRVTRDSDASSPSKDGERKASDPAPHGRWIVHTKSGSGEESEEGPFDAVVVAVGTCGKPRWVKIDGMPEDVLKKVSSSSSDDDKEKKKNDRTPKKIQTAGQNKSNDNTEKHQRERTQSAISETYAEKAKAWTEHAPEWDTILTKPSLSKTSVVVEGESFADAAKTGTTHAQESSGDETEKKGVMKEGESFADAVKEGERAKEIYTTPVKTKADSEEGSSASSPVDTKAWPQLEKEDHDSEKPVETKKKTSKGGSEVYEGPIIHSSELDKPEVRGGVVEDKTVIIVGSGASAVEAAETALARGAKKAIVIARSDKWIIPRNFLIDTFLACQPFGRQMPLSFLWEGFLKHWHYRGVKDLTPKDLGIFEGTPIVNDAFLAHVRTGKCEYVRGDTNKLTKTGVEVNVRKRGTKSGDAGETKNFEADVVVLATGFEKPDVKFLDKELFPDEYERPNLYLQNFSTEDWSVLMTNSSYKNAIGTVGHFHIGIYTRILLTLILDSSARPTPKDMKLWVDVVRFIKSGASGGALAFFTYAELTIWLVGFHLLRPDRIRWFFFIMFGWGIYADSGLKLQQV